MRRCRRAGLAPDGHRELLQPGLPSGFAGDAARAWLAAREGVRLGPAVRAIVCDRVIGLLVLIVMVSVTLLALPDVTADKVPGRR